jgi:hypothetical protein
VTLGTFTADTNGDITFTVTIPRRTTLGAHQLILTDDTTGQQTTLPVIVLNASRIDLDPSRRDLDAGGVVVLHATISGEHQLGTPTGTVTYTDNGVPITSCTALALPASGRASCTVTYPTTTGSPHTIRADYSGNSAYAPATTTATITVRPLRTRMHLTAAPDQLKIGGDSTLTAALSAADQGAAKEPTGTVTFANNGTPIAGCTDLSVTDASATCSFTPTTIGTYQITATYTGDPNWSSARQETRLLVSGTNYHPRPR